MFIKENRTMAPAIIAAIISAAASKVKSNQDNAARMNEGNKTGGNYQIGGSDNNSGMNTYQPSSQSVNTGGSGSQLAESIIKQYLSKKNDDNTQGVAQDTAEEVTENIQ